MINKNTKKFLKEVDPTLVEYQKAKQLVEQFEKNLEKSKGVLDKKFYVKMGFDFYAVGTFGGWGKDGCFLLKVEDVEPFHHIPNTHYISTGLVDVYEKKTKSMKRLHAGIE